MDYYNEMKTTKNRSKYEKKMILLETRKAIYINTKHLKSFSLYAYSWVPGNPEREKKKKCIIQAKQGSLKIYNLN